MRYENVNRCQHVKVNGIQCGSPALRSRRQCFFHHRVQQQRERIANSQFSQARFVGPVLEDANAVQLALMQVMQLLGSGQMDHKTAKLMLYALQTASTNLRRVHFEPIDVTDVVIDRSDVNRTCIGGQQWFEEDFEDEDGEEATAEETETEEENEEEDDEDEDEEDKDEDEEEDQDDDASDSEADGAEEKRGEVAQTVAGKDAHKEVSREEVFPALAAKREIAKIAAPAPVKEGVNQIHQARRDVQQLIHNWIAETVVAGTESDSG